MNTPSFWRAIKSAARGCHLAAALVAALAGCVVGAPRARGQIVWTGTTSGNWGDTTNWSGGLIPNSSTAVANFTSSAGQSLGTVMVNVTTSLGEIAFNATNSAAFTITGNVLDLFGTANPPFAPITAIADSATNTETIASNIIVENAQQWQEAASAGNLVISGAVDLGNFALTINTTNSTLISGLISDTGNLTKIGAGTLTLANSNNSYSGNTTISAGTLSIASDAALGSTGATLIISGGTLLTTGNLSTSRNIILENGGNDTFSQQANMTLTITGSISGVRGLIKAGTGTLALDAVNTFNGATLNAGTLVITSDSNLGISTGGLTLNGGTLDVASNMTTSRMLTFGSLGGTISTDSNTSLTLTGTMSGSGTLTKSGLGNLTILSNTTVANLKISAGTLTLGGSQTLRATTLTMSGGVLDFGTLTSATISGFNGSSSESLSNDSSAPVALTLTTGGTTSYSGNLSGTGGSLIMQGSGSQKLTGNNTYSGGTIVSSGTLIAGSANALPNTGVVSVQGGNLESTSPASLGGLQLISGCISISGLGTFTSLTPVDAQSGTINGILSGTAGLIKTTTGTVTLNGTNTYSGDTDLNAGLLINNTTLALQNSTLNLNGGAFLFGYNISSSTLGGLTGSQNMGLDSPYAVIFEFSRYDYYGPHGIALTIGQNNEDTTYNGNLMGDGSILKTGSGTLTLDGVGTFTGNTTIKAGTLALANRLAIEDSTLVYNIGGGTLNFGTLTSATLGGLSGNQNLNLDNSSAAAVSLTIGNNNSSTTYSGNLSGAGSLTTSSLNTLTLTGTNTYTGNTTINGGTLALNFSRIGAPANNIISSASSLNIAGTLDIIGSNSTTISQTFASTILNAGASIISLNGNSGTVNLNLGAIVRDAGATLDFVTTGNSTVTFLISSGSANSILINGSTPYATVNGTDWAAKNSTNTAVVGLSTINSYVPSTASTLAGPNADIAAGVTSTLLSANDSLTSLRFNQNQNSTVNLGGHQLSVGGILQTASVANTNIGFIFNGTLRSATAGGDLVLIQNSINPLVIDASIVDNGSATGLTMSGSAQVQLNGDNTYTGTTTVSGGTLSLGMSYILSSSANVVVSDGTLDFGTFSQNVNTLLLSNGNIIGPGATLTGHTYNVQSGTISADLAGSAPLVKTSGGTVTLSGNNTFTGPTTIEDGTLALASSRALQNSNVNLLAGYLAFSSIDTTYYIGSLTSDQNIFTNVDNTPEIQLDVGGNNQDSIYSGDFSGAGSLSKSGTGNLTLTSNNTFYGNLTVTGGNLIMSGPNAAVTYADAITVSTNGSANLTITNGASFGGGSKEDFAQSAGSSANITVTGSDSTLYGNLVLGDAGSANLTISNGGSAVLFGVVLGNSTGGFGNIVVTGTNSTFSDVAEGYTLDLGLNGSGSFNVLNGATASSTYAISTGNDTQPAGATATMTVDGRNSAFNGSVVLNYGTVTVSNGGLIHGDGTIGGTALITDPGSVWMASLINSPDGFHVTGCVTVVNGGELEGVVNLNGDGNLTIIGGNSSLTGDINVAGNASQFNLLNGTTFAGNGTLANGTIDVSGAGSDWNNPGAVTLTNGTFIISNGGMVEQGAGSTTSIGNVSVIVTGDGSLWLANSLALGASQSSTGNLSILNGGVVSGSGNIAAGDSTNGYVIVDGSGSQWNSPTLIVGYAGEGYLTVSNGGSVISGNLSIGQGFLTVSNGSSLTASNLTIGGTPNFGAPNEGIGIVTQTGGVVSIGGQLAWGFNNSTYNLSGGVLQVGGIDSLTTSIFNGQRSSNYTFNLAGGTVQIFGSDLTTCVNATLDDNTTSSIDTNGMNATWMGALSGNGSLVKIGEGTLTLSGNNSFAGNTTITAGTLSVTGILAGGSNLTLNTNTTLAVGDTGNIFQGNISLGGMTDLTVSSLAQHSRISVTSLLNYGGNLSLSLGTSLNYGIYNLFLSGSMADDFLNVAITGLFTMVLTDNGGVWSGADASQSFAFNDATGQLTVSGNNSSVASPSRQAWLDSNFSILQMANPAISGDTADPAGDGIPNLLKYALNLDPWVDGHAGIPQPTTDGSNLILSFTEYQSDVIYSVEASINLISWSTIGVSLQTNGNLVTATYPVPASGTAFLRLVVSPVSSPSLTSSAGSSESLTNPDPASGAVYLQSSPAGWSDTIPVGFTQPPAGFGAAAPISTDGSSLPTTTGGRRGGPPSPSSRGQP